MVSSYLGKVYIAAMEQPNNECESLLVAVTEGHSSGWFNREVNLTNIYLSMS